MVEGGILRLSRGKAEGEAMAFLLSRARAEDGRRRGSVHRARLAAWRPLHTPGGRPSRRLPLRTAALAVTVSSTPAALWDGL
ncbi:hypothetical protein EJ06DRAFT_119268 [Trichodelitschia bisporula]|uniref:Uncharacterized protein n=1 Tax=Trichodelitschia bisporula TaxID=703511 RepID=A0A6G1HQH0_9PEZI|nr:hypothetical protein EJ06DRAFT_119268 [Trichodelitschia bisporula]